MELDQVQPPHSQHSLSPAVLLNIFALVFFNQVNSPELHCRQHNVHHFISSTRIYCEGEHGSGGLRGELVVALPLGQHGHSVSRPSLLPTVAATIYLELSLLLSRMMAELMAFLVIFDTIFYYCHRLLHTRNFYKYFC